MAAEPSDGARYRLTAAMRLKQNREFAHVRAQGQRCARGCLIANWLVMPPESASRLGVITSKKVGSAVDRARARRLLRETFRLHQHDFKVPVQLVLVARPSIAGKGLQDVVNDFFGALRHSDLLRKSN